VAESASANYGNEKPHPVTQAGPAPRSAIARRFPGTGMGLPMVYGVVCRPGVYLL
jgi:hypothetical protein